MTVQRPLPLLPPSAEPAFDPPNGPLPPEGRWLRVLPYLLAAGITLLAVLALLHFDGLEREQRQQAQRTDILNRLEAVRGSLERTMAGPMMRTRGMAAQIIAHDGVAPDEFARVAEVLLRGHEAIRSITVSRGTVVQLVYPLAGNEAVLGIDYHNIPNQWPSVQHAIDTQMPVLEGPVPLLQGGVGLILRDPVYLNDTGGGRHFYGLVSLVLDVSKIFARVGIDEGESDLHMAIRGTDGLGAAGGMIFGAEAVFFSNPVEVDVQLPYGNWRLAGIPSEGWLSADTELRNVRALEICLLVVVVLVSFGAARHITERRRLVDALSGAEERFRLVAENIEDYAIFMLDPQGRIVSWTAGAENLIGLAADEVLGEPFSLFYATEDVAAGKPAALLREAAAHGRATEEAWHLRKGGQRFYADVAISRMLDDTGSLLGYAVISRDNTDRKRTEDLLSRQADRFHLLLRTASDGIHVVDQDGNLVEASDSFFRMLGYAPDEAGRFNVAQWDARMAAPELREKIRALIKNPGVFETRHRRRDGSLFDVEINCRSVELEGRHYLYCSSRDISERKINDMARRRSEIELQAATARLKLVLDTAAEGIFGVDDENRIIFANKAAVEMLNWVSPEAVQGKHAEAILGHRLHDHRDCREGSCALRTTLADGILRRISNEYFTGVGGTQRPVEYVVSPLSVEDITVGAVMVFHDVTARMKAERNIRHLLTYQRAILDNTPVGIAILSQDRVIVQANEAFCRIFGHGGHDLCGQTADILYASDELYHEVGQRAYPMVGSGGTFCEDVLMRRSDNSTIWVRLAARMVDPRSAELGVVWSAEDISERRALDQDLRRSNAELERFAYVASHDLRQPLRMISSYLSLIEKRMVGRLEQEELEFMGYAVDGARRMDRMIVDLLDYSRIGRKGGPNAEVALSAVLEGALASLSVLIEETGAEVTTASPLPTVKGYESELERLFQNLIGNAVKFRAPDRAPKVVVSCQESRDEWVLSIADNGIGIAPENHDRLFTIFQRLVSREQYDGTGIGLAACRKIAEHHGGRIWLESALGQGCTFFVALPK